VPRVWVSIGSNQGKEQHIPAAIEDLRRCFGPLNQSSIYESPAFGFKGDVFHNLVVGFDSILDPGEIRMELRHIEDQHSRVRSQEKFSSRTLDLDLLLYDDLVTKQEGFQLPHPDILAYAFVLGPLAEIAPDLLHPTKGMSYKVLWQRFPTEGKDSIRML